MPPITVLSIADRIACFYSLKPFLFCKAQVRFTFTTSVEYCLKRDKSKILIMMRQFIKPDRVDLDLMRALRRKYERLIFFHDDAGGGIPRLEVLPFVDIFYCKAIFKDKSLYTRPLYGKELYSDYYHKKYGVTDEDWRERPVIKDERELDKLRLSWNIGVGDYPRDTLRQRAGVAAARIFGFKAVKPFYRKKSSLPSPLPNDERDIGAHCRIGMIPRKSINFQRELVLKAVKDDALFATGRVSQQAFNREIKLSKMTVSPFGWGELCLRDFEAIRAGSLLLKPDMSHLETWPNVFVPEKTCIFFSWDCDDLVEKAHYYARHTDERERIAANAQSAYSAALSGIDARFSSIISEIVS